MKLNSFYNKMDEWTADKTPFLFLIDFEKKEPLLYKLSSLESIESPLYYSFPNSSNLAYIQKKKSEKEDVLITKKPYSLENYRAKFNKAQTLFIKKNVEVINLTTLTPIESNLGLEDLFLSASAKYKVMLNNRFICFSPEIFIRINAKGVISSYPMKGTIDANIPNARDLILNSTKEEREHRATVALMQRELSEVSDNVSVPRFRYIDHLVTSEKNLLQVSSEVVGVLKSEYRYSFGKLFDKLLPAGSIVGTPKSQAVEIISEVEGYTRGYYTGVCGVFDGKTLDSCVLIRFIEKQENKLVYKSGGGITSDSIAEDEYNEIIDKIYVPLD